MALVPLYSLAFGTTGGPTGFDRLEVADRTATESQAYPHPHHKYVDVSFGIDGLVTLDESFGTSHDGSKSAEE